MTARITAASHSERRLEQLARERREEKDAQISVWTFLWTLFVFKIATIGVILYAARGSWESQAFMYATSWIWLIIPAAAITGPFLYWRRLRAQRKRRERLLCSEWMVEHAEPDSEHVSLVSLGDILPGSEPPKT